VLSDTPEFGGSTIAGRCRTEERSKNDVPDDRSGGLPVRRIGLEQGFFLVDPTGELCDLADLLLRRCREAAEAQGLDPRCFEAECVKSLVEITTLPSSDPEDLANNYLAAPFFRRVASTAQHGGLHPARRFRAPRVSGHPRTWRSILSVLRQPSLVLLSPASEVSWSRPCFSPCVPPSEARR
jgi:hypothetical protein